MPLFGSVVPQYRRETSNCGTPAIGQDAQCRLDTHCGRPGSKARVRRRCWIGRLVAAALRQQCTSGRARSTRARDGVAPPRLFFVGTGVVTEVQNRIVGVVGRKGSGKSTYVHEKLNYCPRFVGFDVMAEHATENANQLESPAELDRFFKWSRRQQTFAGIYVPSGELDEEIEEVSRLVYAHGNLCFI